MTAKNKHQLGWFLLFALAVVFIQVLIGGTTRLTGSGLSMTDWKIVTGTIPPLSTEAWELEFQNYQQSPQGKEINQDMKLADFKSIYFWEWLHRVWGRWGFLVLIAIFLAFLFLKKLDKQALWRFVPLLLLYVAQGLLGWYMVKSGLVDVPRVSHYRLTAHLMLAIFLFAYILWFLVSCFISERDYILHQRLRSQAWGLVALLCVQIVFGAFMSGLRAATHFPTFPDMNGQILPDSLFYMQPFYINFFENITTIQFTHRGLAYILVVLIFAFCYKYRAYALSHPLFRKGIILLPILVLIQVTLGVLVLLNSTVEIPVSLGVCHQGVGLLTLSTMLFIAFQTKKA